MRKRLIHWLGLTGVVALLSYTAAVVFSPLAYPDYNWMAQAVSDLSAEAAPSRQLWNRLAAPYNICSVVCATSSALFVAQERVSSRLFRVGLYLFMAMNWVSAVGYAVHVIADCVTSYDLKKMPEMLAYYTDKGCEVKNLAVYMGIRYHYRRLDNHNFTGHSLDDFVRHQTVTACWRKINNDWKLVPNIYEENWSQAQCREIAEDVARHINLDQTGFGAFDGERIIGFATVSHRIFGVTANYAQLVCFQISEEYRRQGIGRKLFSLACEEARRLGADKLYISAHSSKESQAAYRALGCMPAEEVNEGLAAAEPFDVQMEYRL